jgi:hypothetical protein
VLNAAWKMDTVGNKIAKKEIAMIKVLAPNMACQVIDWAMQVHGGGGVATISASPRLRARAHAALRRRPRRGAPQPDREAGDRRATPSFRIPCQAQAALIALVLGAGIVGVSIALHLQKRGRCDSPRRPARRGRRDLVRQRRPGAARGGLSVRLSRTTSARCSATGSTARSTRTTTRRRSRVSRRSCGILASLAPGAAQGDRAPLREADRALHRASTSRWRAKPARRSSSAAAAG